MSQTFNIDYTNCPKGHNWIFIPDSILCYEVWWCEDCQCFYEPTVRKLNQKKIDEQFGKGRSEQLKQRANFIKWKSNLKMADFINSPKTKEIK